MTSNNFKVDVWIKLKIRRLAYDQSNRNAAGHHDDSSFVSTIQRFQWRTESIANTTQVYIIKTWNQSKHYIYFIMLPPWCGHLLLALNRCSHWYDAAGVTWTIQVTKSQYRRRQMNVHLNNCTSFIRTIIRSGAISTNRFTKYTMFLPLNHFYLDDFNHASQQSFTFSL